MADTADNALEVRKRPRSRREDFRHIATALPEPPDAQADESESEENWDEQAAREQREMYAELAPQRRRTARIPERWLDITLEDFERDSRAPAIDAARKWAVGDDDAERGLLLHGPVGRGKTRIAAAAAVARCGIGPVRWRNVADLLLALSYSFEHPERERALSFLRPSPHVALVLDDFDKTKATDHALQPLYMAVNAWVEAKQPMIVTMNRDLDALERDFGERFGDPIASRLAGYCAQFDIGGADRRLPDG